MDAKTLAELKAGRDREFKAAEDLAAKAQSENRTLGPDEMTEINGHVAEAKKLDALCKREAADRKVMEDMKALGERIGLTAGPDPRYERGLGRRSAGWGQQVAAAAMPRGKALLPAGSQIVAVPAPPVIQQGIPVDRLRSILNVEPTDGVFGYLAATVRTNNAAPVAVGALKPTSIYSLVPRTDRVRTIAHLSEPIPRQYLSDSGALATFLDSELQNGLELALEAQILDGDGTGENFTGLANTAGTGHQDFDTDPIQTCRKALTVLQNLNLPATAFVMAPSDFEAIDLATTTAGAYLMQPEGPVDTAAQRLWGRPVVLSTSCTPGTGYVGDWTGSATLYQREDATVDWSEAPAGSVAGQASWATNEVRFRCEGRWGWAVLRPAGFVEIDLVAGAPPLRAGK